eukprot:12724116-Alexandrium_andersonii.AAC.1
MCIWDGDRLVVDVVGAPFQRLRPMAHQLFAHTRAKRAQAARPYLARGALSTCSSRGALCKGSPTAMPRS